MDDSDQFYDASPVKDLVLCLPGANNDQQLYSKKLHADIFLTLKNSGTVFPLHSYKVKTHSGWLRTNAIQKNLVIQENFKEEDLSKIISLFYGFQVKVQRVDVAKYYHILAFLQVDSMLRLIEKDMRDNIEEHDIFVVLQLAHRYNIKDLIDQCLRQLLNGEFQQMRYNLFDLLRCSEDVFKLVINYHNKMKSEGKTTGFSWEDIQDIIRQYSDTNKLTTIKTTQLLHTLVDHKELFIEESMKKAGNNLSEDAPISRIIASRNQQNNRSSMTRKLSQSYIKEHYVVTPPITTPKSSTFYSHIFDIQHQDTEPEKKDNNPPQNQNFSKKQSNTNLLTTPQENYKDFSSNQSNDGSKEAKPATKKVNNLRLLNNPLQQGTRAVSREVLQKKESNQEPKKKNKFKEMASRIGAQTESVEYDYSTDNLNVKINAPSSPSSTNNPLAFKTLYNTKISKNNKVSITQQEPLTESQKKITNQSNLLSTTNTNNNVRQRSPYFFNKDSKKLEQTKSTNNLQDTKIPKFQSQSIILIQSKDSMKIDQGQFKSAANIAPRGRRNTSFFPQNQKSFPKLGKKKSQALKEVEELNMQSKNVKQNNEELLQQLKKLNSQMNQNQVQNKAYKESLNKIEANLQLLEKSLRQNNYVFNALEQKVTLISNSIRVNKYG